jgi:hypothetical protein
MLSAKVIKPLLELKKAISHEMKSNHESIQVIEKKERKEDRKRSDMESNFLEEKKKSLTDEDKEEKKEKQEEEKDAAQKIKPEITSHEKKAAHTILNYWRTSKIIKNFYEAENGYDVYLNMLLPLDEKTAQHSRLSLLAKLMFGRTIAATQNDEDFPFQNPFVHASAQYHRDDDLTSQFLDQILADFETKIDKQQYSYIPLSILENTPIVQTIDTYLSQYKISMRLLTQPKSYIAFLKINKSDPNCELIKEKIRATGLIASPWQLSSYYIEKKLDKNFPPKKLSLPDIGQPNTMQELLSDPCIIHLKKIAEGNRSTRYLAQSLFQMLALLENTNIDKEIIKRIFIFLNMGVKFYKNNYTRFSVITYGIVHELSMSLIQNPDAFKEIVNYQTFKKDAELHAISYFGLDKKERSREEKYRSIAFPANSGTNAYVIAMNLAKKMELKMNAKPTIKVVGSLYFEFENLDKVTKNEDADIYLVSTGPIISFQELKETIVPGVNINALIRKRMALKPMKPCTFVIDSTSGLYKNLTLDKDIQDLIHDGSVSVIVHESHQKFGLLHTDQAQYGRVFGLCSKNHFSDQLIQSLEKKAEIDMNHIPDMKIGAFINIACSDILEKIKEQHFKNGDICRRVLERLGTKSNIHQDEDMLGNSHELFFNIFTKTTPISEEVKRHLTRRDSFGHFASTFASIANIRRISMSASDPVDALIETSLLFLSATYSEDALYHFLNEYLLEFDPKKNMATEDEVIFFAITSILKNNLFRNKDDLITQFQLMTSLSSFIETRDKSIIGRKCFNKLFRTFQCHANQLLGPKTFQITFKQLHNHIKQLEIKNANPDDFIKCVNSYLISAQEKDQPESLSVAAATLIIHLRGLKHDIKLISVKHLALVSEAIVKLHQENILNQSILDKLISPQTSYPMTANILQLASVGHLTAKNIEMLTSQQHKADALSQLITAQVTHKIIISSLLNENKEMDEKENLHFIEAINKLPSYLLHFSFISKLLQRPEYCQKIIEIPENKPDLMTLNCLLMLSHEESLHVLNYWEPHEIRAFYHYIKENPEVRSFNNIPEAFMKNIIDSCNAAFCEKFYKTYEPKRSFFTPIGASLFARQLYDKNVKEIDAIESGAKESKETEQILTTPQFSLKREN